MIHVYKVADFSKLWWKIEQPRKVFLPGKRRSNVMDMLYAIESECLKMSTVFSKRPSVARRLAAAPPLKEKTYCYKWLET